MNFFKQLRWSIDVNKIFYTSVITPPRDVNVKKTMHQLLLFPASSSPIQPDTIQCDWPKLPTGRKRGASSHDHATVYLWRAPTTASTSGRAIAVGRIGGTNGRRRGRFYELKKKIFSKTSRSSKRINLKPEFWCAKKIIKFLVNIIEILIDSVKYNREQPAINLWLLKSIFLTSFFFFM